MRKFPADNKNITIAVALSGGVDSSVAAALLKKQGYNVVAFFMKNWGDTYGLRVSECPWLQDREDAMRAAAKLDIPFHTLDFEEEYKNQVLDYFFREYAAGRTPNPDVMCNSTIKFGVFLDKARELGADYIATGHYARLRREFPNPNFQFPNNNQNPNSKSPLPSREGLGEGSRSDAFRLLKSKDQNKDQTYFLYRLTQTQLSRALFPIGEYTKLEVRQMAKKFGLPNHDKRDSQGVCFIGHIDLRKFLSQKIKDQPGDIVTVEGKIVGQHQGLFWYTIGQRKGIEIGGIGPFYVVEKDLANNQLIVTNNPQDERLYKSVVEFNDVNWIDPSLVETRYIASHKFTGRIRYREELVECAVEKMDSIGRRIGDLQNDPVAQPTTDYRAGNNVIYRATFKKPQRAVAAGQSIVFYDKDVCLGGGTIT